MLGARAARTTAGQAALSVLAVALLGSVAGCTGSGGVEASPPAPSQPAPVEGSPTAAAPTGSVTVTRDWRETTVELVVHPLQVRGEVAVLSYGLHVAEADKDPMNTLTLALDGGDDGLLTSRGRSGGVRLFDSAALTVSAVGVNAEDQVAGTVERLGGTDAPWDVTGTALFAPPPGDTVDVLFPELGAVLDVPVVDAGETFDTLVEGAGGLAEPRLASLRVVQQAYDASSATAADAETITVTLTSDVLFAPDADALTPEAQAAVDQAASAVREQADGGAVQVIGHTDDVDTDVYNQALSERRAQAVAARLSAALGEGFSVTSEGRGEGDPAVDGTSAEARAANRRVEIEFEGHMILEAEPEEKLPPTSAQTVSNGPVELEANGSRYSVEVDSVVRRPGALVGTLRGELLEGSGSVAWFLPTYGSLIGERNFRAVSQLGGTHNLSLLTGADRVLPFDYEGPGDDGASTRRLLGEELIGQVDSVGDVVLITVVWPDTGQDTVTIDAPERFRITDVPVTDG